jgi:hypothetical protein
MRRRLTKALGALSLTAAVLAPSVALAHPVVDEARAAYGSAEFDRALSWIDDALARTDLEREDLVEAYEIRSLVLYAMGEELEMHRALLALAVVAPGFEVPDTHPPAWRAAFDRARDEARERPLGIALDADEESEALVISAEARGDFARLARDWVLTWAREGEEPATARASTVRVPWLDARAVIASAAMVGPGGVELAREDDVRFDRPSSGALSSPWLWIGIGVGVAAAAAIVIAILLRPEANTVIDGAQVVPAE